MICNMPLGRKKEKGVELLLREDVGGRPRVTNTKRIICQTVFGIQKSIENEPKN